MTPPSAELDPLVARLLLESEPLLPATDAADAGFVVPREILLNRAPRFEWLKRNVFVSRERPKRMAKDDQQVCNCRCVGGGMTTNQVTCCASPSAAAAVKASGLPDGIS
jgi:hypothetical protein